MGLVGILDTTLYRTEALFTDLGQGKLSSFLTLPRMISCVLSDTLPKLFCWVKRMSLVTLHYGDVIMGAMASQIISLTIVYSSVNSGTDQRKQQSSPPLVFVRGIQSHTNVQYCGKCFRLKTSSWHHQCTVPLLNDWFEIHKLAVIGYSTADSCGVYLFSWKQDLDRILISVWPLFTLRSLTLSNATPFTI